MRAFALATALLIVSACASTPSAPPLAAKTESILIVPPIDETLGKAAAKQYASTLTRALVDRGYYVFPSSVVSPVLSRLKIDASTPDALSRLDRVFGADAVLTTRIREYGRAIHISCALVDARSGRTLWEGEVEADESGELPVETMVELANARAFAGLPPGPHHPQYGKWLEERRDAAGDRPDGQPSSKKVGSFRLR